MRFASNVEEIGISAVSPPQAAIENARRDGSMEASDVTPDQIQALANSLRGANLQEQRLKSFSFYPVSLPASRVSDKPFVHCSFNMPIYGPYNQDERFTIWPGVGWLLSLVLPIVPTF